MELVAASYSPVSLDAIVDWVVDGRRLPERAVAVTFDDGFRDVLEHAAPIMARFGVPGAAFIPSAIVSGSPPDSSYAPTRPFMDWPEVVRLAESGWTIGSHSLDHPRLAALDERDARRQLAESRDALEQHLGRDVKLLAYPYGTASTVSPRDRQLALETGYRAAFMDMIGPIERDSDVYALPRAKVLGTDRMMVVAGSLRGDMDLWRRVESRMH
jgi:peptidoglycan/xylan/chitin deacetylase (PgdA/CDA1 family)